MAPGYDCGFAAYGVVLFHTSRFLRGNQATVDVPDIVVGAAGVDLFFVISGFVMVYVAKPHDTPGQFMLRRFIRIAPLYWLATLAVIATVWIIPWFFQDADLSWPSVLKSLAFIPAYNSVGFVEPVLFLGWTLNFEMVFYAIFACSLLLPVSYRLIGIIAGITALWASATLIGTGAAAEFFSNAIIFEFVFGCLIATVVVNDAVRNYLSRPLGAALAMTGVAGFVLIPIAPDFIQEAHRLFKYGVPAALIVSGLVIIEMTSKEPLSLPLQSLGNSSYSAYLLHAFIVPIFGNICFRLFPASWASVALVVIGVFALTMIAATISYRLIELRLSKALRAALAPTQQRKEQPG